MKLVADGEDHLKITASQCAGLPPLQPKLRICRAALRATAVSAGVIDSCDVISVGAGFDVLTLELRPAGHDRLSGILLSIAQTSFLSVGFKMVDEYALNDSGFHFGVLDRFDVCFTFI